MSLNKYVKNIVWLKKCATLLSNFMSPEQCCENLQYFCPILRVLSNVVKMCNTFVQFHESGAMLSKSFSVLTLPTDLFHTLLEELHISVYSDSDE